MMTRSINRCTFAMLALAVAAVLAPQQAAAHCQVPCGIYGDDARFTALLEDATTIAKATAQINELSGSHDAQGANQLIRWVTTKEAHASNIQKVIGDYFMAQRIKATDPQYVAKLTASHAVIVAAMKAKQSADPATAAALTKAIEAFAAAYNGEAHSHEGHAHEAHHSDHGHGEAAHSHGEILDHVLPASGNQLRR